MPTKEEMNRIFELKKQINELNAELSPLEQKQTQEQNASWVGRYFKYNNSYSGGERWWLYVKVVDAGDYWPTAITFQHTSNDEIQIRTEKTMTSLGNGYQEISEAEFEAAWQSLMTDIAKIGRTLQNVK